MSPGAYCGAVYNNYLAKQMDLRTEELRQVINDYDSGSWVGKFFSSELRIMAARDLIDSRENPQGEIAQKINWKLEDYRKEQVESARNRRAFRNLVKLVF